jgi:hypothetical protein
MDSPNNTTNSNSGNQATTVPVEEKPSRGSAQVWWNTSASTP